jgi:hypothetical protein
MDKLSYVDKEYLEGMLEERIDILKDRYNQLNRLQDEYGNAVKYSVAAVNKSLIRKDLRTCILVLELMHIITEDELTLTQEAMKGLDRLIEPMERFRNLRAMEANNNDV